MTKTIRPGTVIENVDIIEIKRILPHRYPILMIDRVENIVPDISATGIKNVTSNEPQFQGHFPDKPIMPGVMLVEAMAQTAAILVAKSDESINSDKNLKIYVENDFIYLMLLVVRLVYLLSFYDLIQHPKYDHILLIVFWSF